jgi:outer membrane lipoprotein-sorting protein
MTYIMRAAGLLVLAIAFAAPARAQTADEVVEKHLAALGGREALGKLTSRHATGTVVLTTPAGDLSGPFESYAKAPNKMRISMQIDTTAVGGPGTMTVEQKFDGTKGWMLNSLQGDTEMTGNLLDNMRNGGFPSPLLTFKQAGAQAALQPRETLRGKEALVLLLTPTAGSPVRVYFDPDTYLVMRTVSTINSPQVGGNIEQTSDFSDYRAVDGVKVAFQTINANSIQTITIKLTKVEHNVAIDDGMFGKK